jgi:signal transduction histidine kinase
MTAGIAHEFRNGLATIHGYSRLMDPDSLPDPYRVYVEGIRQETDTLGRVITNFLNFARPEPLSLTPLDLEVVARRAADELRAELPEDTSLIVDGAFGSIQGDDILLRQVFANLIRNAAEACAIARRRPAIAIAGHVDTAARTAIVSVDDNGPGIPHADRARVFQPFFTTRSRGSGLGLSIVQKIVLLHNGRISVGVSTDGGAQVQLTFPLAA